MGVPDPGPVVTLLFGGVAVLSVLRYYSIFHHSFQLRKARAFLHYRQYEPVISVIGLALLAATALIFYALAADPGSLQLYDAIVYMSLQVLLAVGMLYSFLQVRKAGKQ